jgi:hypothetical protein
MNQREELVKRRDSVLGAARAVAEKARTESRELTADETAQIDLALTESREINEKLAADDRHKNIMGQLNAMASSSTGLLGGDGRRLAFGKQMASDAADKIMPPSTYGAKAVAVSGTAVVAQQFVADPVQLGQPPTSLLSVLPVTVQTSPQSRICDRVCGRTPPRLPPKAL